MTYTICWLFEINRHCLEQFLLEHNEHMFIFVFFPKSDERYKFELFYRRFIILRDGFQSDHQPRSQGPLSTFIVERTLGTRLTDHH